MSEFLNKLKNAVETEDFNSEAAQRINKIDELADKKTAASSQEELDKRLEVAGVRNVSAEEAAAISSQYEEKMAKIKEDDAVNAQTATLIEIDDVIQLSIGDMFEFIEGLETKFSDKFKEAGGKFDDNFAKENEAYIRLYEQLVAMKARYAKFMKND